MEVEVYADVLAAVNLAADFFLLLGLGKLLGLRGSGKRILAAAVFGAVSGTGAEVLLLFLRFSVWTGEGGVPERLFLPCFSVFALIFLGGIMVVLAFGWCRLETLLTRLALLLCLAAFAEGILELLLEGFWAFDTGRNLVDQSPAAGSGLLLLLFLLACSLCLSAALGEFVVRRLRQRARACMVRLSFREKVITVPGIVDTGNTLCAPVTGTPVHVAEASLLQELCPFVEGITLIPYRTIDGGGHLLKAVTLDKLEILADGKEACQAERVLTKPLVAASPVAFPETAGYRILLHL